MNNKKVTATIKRKYKITNLLQAQQNTVVSSLIALTNVQSKNIKCSVVLSFLGEAIQSESFLFNHL